MTLSFIARNIHESITLKLNETAARLRDKGEPVIHLGGGEPKSKAPIEALIAGAGMLSSGEVRYTPADGIPAMKKAIIRYTEEFYGRLVEPANVMASSGAKQAIMCAMQAVLNPQDEVIFPAPYWVSYPEMAKLCGAIPVAITPEDGRFEPRIEEIEEHVGRYTKLIILNSPNNPSGVTYSAELVSAVVELCEKRGLYLIMDDIYHRLLFDGRRPESCYQYAKDLSESCKIIVVNGVSKQYAMTGFRIGWAVANKKLIEAMTVIQGQQTSGPSALLQCAAVAAMNGPQSGVESLRLTLENNRNVLVDRLRAFDGVNLVVPHGTFYSFPDFSAWEKSSEKLAAFLLDKVRVVVVPGKEFGMEGHIRISYCGSIKDIKEGMERIRWALDPNAPNELYMGGRKLVRDWL
ncbi:MAG: aminotransferase [Deltaproteobacteria bacterium RIFOXYA12_FULL_58_15]|nr:MAG: aminotransferase [Deltaproteobacteria bacterium RIFOXYA12_FULL_58_15]